MAYQQPQPGSAPPGYGYGAPAQGYAPPPPQGYAPPQPYGQPEPQPHYGYAPPAPYGHVQPSPHHQEHQPVASVPLGSAGPDGYSQLPASPSTGGPKPPRRCCGITCDDAFKHKLNIANLVIGAVVSLVLLILSTIAYRQMSGFVNDYQEVVHSWKELPIVDVQVSTTAGCPAGYKGVYSYWPGLYDACDCSTKRRDTNSTSSDTTLCSSEQTSDGCFNRHSQHKYTVDLDVFTSSRFCVRRGGESALKRPALVDGKCPTGYRVCGSNATQAAQQAAQQRHAQLWGASSTLPPRVGGGGGALLYDYRVCWPVSQSECPITDIGLTTNQELTLAQAGADGRQSGAIVQGTTRYYLYYKRGGVLSDTYFSSSIRSPGSFGLSGLPIVDITFQNSAPCTLSGCGYSGASYTYNLQSATYKYNHAYEGYQLRPRACEGGCYTPKDSSISPSGRDVRWIGLASVSEHDLFSRYPTIPYEFVTSQDKPWNYILSIKSEIEWNAHCKRRREDVVDKETEVSGVRAAQLAMLVISVLSFVILALYFPLVQCVRPDIFKQHEKKNKCLKYSFKAISLVCTVVTVIVALNLLAFWSDIVGDDSDASRVICSDPLTSETFSVLHSTFGGLSQKNKINSISSGGSSALEFVHTVAARL